MQENPVLEIARNLPDSGCSPEAARRYTRWLATHHYENFSVVSWLLPRRLHQHFYNVYSYCRWADDLGDEVPDPKTALKLLDAWDEELQETYEGHPSHPVFIALAETVKEIDIPIEPFRDLLIAFRQDQKVHRYDNWNGVLDYCRFSANPVGRLVLYLTGYRDAERQALSDATCTALQLANFWQDVDRDLEKNRIYIPLDLLYEKGLTVEDLFSRNFDDRYVKVMQSLIARTRTLFAAGAPLAGRVSASLRVDVELFSRGGLAVLDRIENIGYNTLHHRPEISRTRKIGLLGRALLDRCFTWILPSAPPDGPESGAGGTAGGGTNAAAGSGVGAAGNATNNRSSLAGRYA